MAQRSDCLVPLGWFVAVAIYFVQACILMKFLAEHTGNNLYWIGVIFYFVLAVVVMITLCRSKGYADDNDELCVVWLFWGIYVVFFMISVAIIFSEVADKLETSDTYGPNFLKSMLCITPALLVLVLQLVICPSYRRSIVSLSVFAALDIFDCIEMLEIVLMQNEREDFNLDDAVEKAIIAFACMSFVVNSIGLTLHKFGDDGLDDGNIVERDGFAFLIFLEILFTNVPFLALRIYVWDDCGFEASIFLAKNILALVVGMVEFGISCKCCTCE